MKVLVTDGHLKAALSAVRHLGRMGLEVHTTQQWPGATVCSSSVFTHRTHLLPPPEEEGRFDARFVSLLQQERFDYLFPTSDTTLRQISRNRDRIAALVRLDLPPKASLDLVFSKVGLIEVARSLKMRVPQTVLYKKEKGAGPILDSLAFPIVAKTFPGETYDRVKYLNNVPELDVFLGKCTDGKIIFFQEYIEGTGFGFFTFCENGKPLLCQMHQRIWEYPVTGGPSVFAKSIQDPVLEELGIRLLQHLRWHGLAMVEFKKPRHESGYALMEVNPRLWGSLDLSITSGADFLSLALASDRTRSSRTFVVTETSYLWLAPDSVLFLISRPWKVRQFLKLLFSSRIHKDLHFDDLRPFLQQLREVRYWVRKLLFKGRLRYPHGKPCVPHVVAQRRDSGGDGKKAGGRIEITKKEDSKMVAAM